MRVNRTLKIAVAAALAAASLAASLAAYSQEAPQTTELETIIVTGTYIKGTAEDAALPVDVITTDDLQKQGSPTMLELVRSIPAVQGIIGESNQFGVSQGAGTSNINLRGLGPTRTLVLLNGKRLAGSPTGTGVDTNLLPMAAIARVEVLKDGAAATYGSDAIAGVVNFITRDNLDGFAVDASYSYIEGADGDYNANLAWGWRGNGSNVLLAGGYRHRSMLPTLERDWAIRPRSVSPEGGWTGFSNPGTFAIFSGTGVPLAPAAGGALLDPACTVLGGTAVPTCTFQYTAYDNLVEEENNYHAYGEYNVELTDNLKLHVEANWGMHDVPEEHGSPSYGPNQGPSGGAPNYIIPLANPGLQALLPFLSSGQQALVNASRIGGQPSILVSGLQWRPFAQGGNPLTGGPQLNSRKFDAFRGSFNLSGEVADAFNWTAGATYMENGSVISTPDFLVSRLQLALQGLGGPNCTGTTAGANGCLWLNPFSTAIPNNPALGLTNTLTYTPTTANSPALISWFTAPNSYEATTKLLAVDAVLNGELSALALPGGNVGWAFGLQYRENSFERVITDDFANLLVTPCPQTPVNPAATCTTATTAPSGALSFYFPLVPTDVKQKVSSAFVEFNLPIVDKLNAQLAVRHENYSDGVGSTTNPKLSLRYQPIDSLTFRASGGTTFRAPPQTSLSGSTTFLFFTPQAGGYKPVDTFGNAKLKPETADTLNVGMIVKLAGFTGSVDYWHFTFKDALTTEIGTQLVTAMYSSYVDGLGVTQLDHCNDPAYAALLARFTFTSVGCRNPGYNPAIGATTGANAQAATLLRTRVNQINAQTDTTVSGIDASLAYVFDGVLGGALTLGAEGTYNLEYQLGANYVEGVLIDPATDAIGTRGGRAGSLPQWKGSAFVDLGTGAHNIRLTSRSVASMDEKYRPATFAVNTGGQHIGGFTTYDLTYRLQVMGDTTVSASVINLTDKDPPFARLDLNYDPFIANPLGRYFKVGVGTKF